jgi:hypothetical protein
MRWLLAASLIALGWSAAHALECPPGAYAWVNKRGVEYCKREIVGPPAAAAGLEVCPAGTRPLTDRRGNIVCRREADTRR